MMQHNSYCTGRRSYTTALSSQNAKNSRRTAQSGHLGRKTGAVNNPPHTRAPHLSAIFLLDELESLDDLRKDWALRGVLVGGMMHTWANQGGNTRVSETVD